ncbi:MAG: flagellar biosynthetic protein FliO [Lachnospiraceae bacterium]|nr:flagellar biosynthetic protein FliO [Lachnospiraceae bacterium]
MQDILQLLTVIAVFVLVLAATRYATKWIAKSGAIQTHSANIKVIETFKIAPNKYIQIVQLGTKYYSIGVTKDTITFLTSLEEEQLDFTERASAEPQIPFKEILNRLNKAGKKEKREK